MPSNRRVIWSLESSKQLQSIKEYVLDEWSKNEWDNFLTDLKTFEQLVRRFPQLYPKSLKDPQLRKAPISKHQSVIYEIDHDVIMVHTILDHRQKNKSYEE